MLFTSFSNLTSNTTRKAALNMNMFKRNSVGPPSSQFSTNFANSEDLETRTTKAPGWLSRIKTARSNTFPLQRHDSGRQAASPAIPSTLSDERGQTLLCSKTAPLSAESDDVHDDGVREKLSPAREYEQMPPNRRFSTQNRVKKMSEFLKSGSEIDHAPPNTDNESALTDGTPQKVTIPPLNEDFLFLSLNAMTHPTATISLEQHPVVCRICDAHFAYGTREVAWRLHSYNGRAHVVHVHCLWKGWAEDAKPECGKCDALRSQIRRCGVENVKKRLERLEDRLM